jgi:hypothetical protein
MAYNGKEEKEDQIKRWLDTIENNMRVVDVCIRDIENLDQ